MIATHLISNSLKTDWLSQAIHALVSGQPIKLEDARKTYTASQFFLQMQEQVFHGINTKHHTLQKSEILDVQEPAHRETPINLPPKNFSALRVGYLLAQSPHYSHLEKILNQIKSDTGYWEKPYDAKA